MHSNKVHAIILTEKIRSEKETSSIAKQEPKNTSHNDLYNYLRYKEHEKTFKNTKVKQHFVHYYMFQ